jgi:hypothetical protein
MTTRIPDDATEEARLAGIRGRLLGTIEQERTPRFSRAQKASAVVAAAAGLAVALTGGAIAVVQASQEQVHYSARCFPTASITERYADVGVPRAVDRVTGQEAERLILDPVTACGDLWRMGLVGRDVAPADPNAADFPVPALVGCTLQNGVGAAFPRGASTLTEEEFCRDLGLAGWSG